MLGAHRRRFQIVHGLVLNNLDETLSKRIENRTEIESLKENTPWVGGRGRGRMGEISGGERGRM